MFKKLIEKLKDEYVHFIHKDDCSRCPHMCNGHDFWGCELGKRPCR